MFHRFLQLFQKHRNACLLVCVLGMCILTVLVLSNVLFKSVVVENTQTEFTTRAIVMPHHDLIVSLFPQFYEAIVQKERDAVERVFIISPNHFEPLVPVIKTDREGMTLPKSMLVVDTKVFAKEHGVALHLPYISKYFPNAEVTPLLLTRNVSQTSLDRLVQQIQEEMGKKKTLIIISSDFSHDLPFAEAERRDEEILRDISAGNTGKVLTRTDEYTDCPTCLYVVMRLMSNARPDDILFHGNSAQYITANSQGPTTSYYVLRWR